MSLSPVSKTYGQCKLQNYADDVISCLSHGFLDEEMYTTK